MSNTPTESDPDQSDLVEYLLDQSNLIEYLAADYSADCYQQLSGQTIDPVVANSIITSDQINVREACHFILHDHPNYNPRPYTIVELGGGVETGLRVSHHYEQVEIGPTIELIKAFRYHLYHTAVDGHQRSEHDLTVGYNGLTVDYIDPLTLQGLLYFETTSQDTHRRRQTLIDLITKHHYDDITIDWDRMTVHNISGQRDAQSITNLNEILTDDFQRFA